MRLNKVSSTPIFWLLSLLALMLLVSSGQTSAAWYQAQGQALIVGGDKYAAKQRATEEAIRQALMFAGASVTSTQTLTNGLLEQDALQVTSSGEVRLVEKVNERWHKDFVTVTIRADIFPNLNTCASNSSLKTIATAPFTMNARGQLVEGGIQNFHLALVKELQETIRKQVDHFTIESITPYSIAWQDTISEDQAKWLGRANDSQLVLFGHITDASIQQDKDRWLGLRSSTKRNIDFRIKLIDAMNGAILMDNHYTAQAPWKFSRVSQVDTSSAAFWQSEYGRVLQQQLDRVVADLNEAIDCQPTTGRVLEVANNQIVINLGKAHGLNVGDSLALYQKNILIDQRGMRYTQYNLHPEKLVAISVNYDNALMVAENGSIVSNIQPNDFVIQN